jgi:hypothetical protein
VIRKISKAKGSLLWIVCSCCINAKSQDLDPRIYANLPKGMNAVGVLYGIAKGNVVTDPSLPIADFKITSNYLGAAYVRTFGLANKLSRVQVSLPFAFMSGKLKINGRDTAGARTGFGDMRIRFGMNLLGSPALDKKDFRKYQQKTIVGASLVISVPTGLYYKDKRINIGAHRWAFKPEVGISRRFNVCTPKHTRVYGFTPGIANTSAIKYWNKDQCLACRCMPVTISKTRCG